MRYFSGGNELVALYTLAVDWKGGEGRLVEENWIGRGKDFSGRLGLRIVAKPPPKPLDPCLI